MIKSTFCYQFTRDEANALASQFLCASFCFDDKLIAREAPIEALISYNNNINTNEGSESPFNYRR